MEWYRIELTKEEIAADRLSEIQSKFDKIFTALQAPRQLALYAENDTPSGSITVYCTLGTAVLAPTLLSEFGFQPCSRPRSKLGLLVGHADSVE